MAASLMGIDDTLDALLNCICEALAQANAPVCTCSNTIGRPVIGMCCECNAGEGELWGNLMRTYRSDRNTLADTPPAKPCMPATWAAQYQITLARCFPTIDETGELPEAEERDDAAQNLHADVATIQRAIHCCADTEPPFLEGLSVNTDPEGGCSFLIATVRVPVTMAASKNLRVGSDV